MKNSLLTFICLLSSYCCFSQKAHVKWGEEFKMRKGSTGMSVIYTDNTGVYLKEKHLQVTGYYVVAASFKESASLVKLDNDLNQKYNTDFNKELSGKAFDNFFVLQGKLYIVASDYSKREKKLTLYIAAINKNTGDITSDWKVLASWEKEENNDNINFKLGYNGDSTKMILVSSIHAEDKNNYWVQEYDDNLKPIGSPVALSNEFEPKTYQLEDVIYTTNNKIVLVGRIYEYEEGRKKKNKFLDFSRYNVRIYNTDGKMINEVNTSINGKWLLSTKVMQEPSKDLILAAFYSNEKKGREVNGMLVQRIDPTTGNIVTTSQKELNTSLISSQIEENAIDADNDKDRKSKEKEKLDEIKDDAEGFSRYMQFRNVFYTADQGMVILAENYQRYTKSYTSRTGSITTTHYEMVFACGDLMMAKIDNGGIINWLTVLPKNQREQIGLGSYPGEGWFFSSGNNYFVDMLNKPYYAGFGAMQTGDKINIFFNDNANNANVIQLGQKIRPIYQFGNSDCFNVSLDATTGNLSRNLLFRNADVPTAMPRLGSVIGKNMFIVGSDAKLFGKTQIIVGKITVD